MRTVQEEAAQAKNVLTYADFLTQDTADVKDMFDRDDATASLSSRSQRACSLDS